MRYVEAPEYAPYNSDVTIFLAGGVTGCPDWQSDAVARFQGIDNLTVFNPRRKEFPIHDPMAAWQQIRWEFNYLNEAGTILFWFPKETLCPIALYELGRASAGKKRLFVGTDPQYARRQDVEIQLRLAGRLSGALYATLEETVYACQRWLYEVLV